MSIIFRKWKQVRGMSISVDMTNTKQKNYKSMYDFRRYKKKIIK